ARKPAGQAAGEQPSIDSLSFLTIPPDARCCPSWLTSLVGHRAWLDANDCTSGTRLETARA
ncbi:hypothetical protein, partial [Actinophytocola sp.]|uniref:hypothetical protein n=1 Tax=Actinophytocola sp. TaxID=1872138 RepID=UPI0038999177